MAKKRLVIVNAGTLAGYRRTTASLSQLHDAVRDLHEQEPDAIVTVIGDAALKWDLPEDEHEALEDDIVNGRIVFAPAGAKDGHVAFIARVAQKARSQDLSPIAITDQAIPDCQLGRVRREGSRWVFDLDAFEATVHAAPGTKRRRPRRPA